MMYPYQNLSLEDLPGEIWKDIPGYEGFYQVSNTGRVKSFRKKGPVCEASTPVVRVMKSKKERGGYVQIGLNKYRKRITYKVHRLVLLAFIGPSDLQIDHVNGIKTDNRLENLEYVTIRENVVRYNRNRRKLPIGVHFHPRSGKYRSRITIDGKYVSLGMYDSIEEASRIYEIALADLDKAHEFIKTSPTSKHGTGIRLKKKKFEVYLRCTYLGRYSTISEAITVRDKFLCSINTKNLTIIFTLTMTLL